MPYETFTGELDKAPSTGGYTNFTGELDDGVEQMKKLGTGIVDTLSKGVDQFKQSFDMYKKPWDAGIETAATLGTGMGAMVAAPIGAGVQAAVNLSKGQPMAFEKNYGGMMGDMTYHPKTELGQTVGDFTGQVINQLGIPMAALHFPSIKPGEAVNAFKASRDVAAPTSKANVKGRINLEAAAEKLKGPEKYIPFEGQLDSVPRSSAQEGLVGPRQPLPEPAPGPREGAAGRETFQAMNDRLGFQEGANSSITRVDPMAAMAGDLIGGAERQRAALADQSILARDTEMQQRVATQTGLDFNAAERARQEAAPLPAKEGAKSETPLVVEAQKTVETQQAKVETVKQDVAAGRVLPTELVKETRALQEATVALETAQNKVVPETPVVEASPKAQAAAAWLDNVDKPGPSFNTRTRGQGGGMLIDFGKKKQTPDGTDIPKIKLQLEDLGRRYVDGKMTFSEYKKPAEILIAQLGEAERITKARDSMFPATSVSEVHPGYNIIPEGTTILAKNREGIPVKVKVTGTYGIRDGVSAMNLPTVDFGQGRRSRLLPSDILEVYSGPRSIKSPGNKQGGNVLINWRSEKGLDQMKKVPGMDKRLKQLLPDQSTPAEFFTEHANTPDINQNILQRALNQGTKGGVYMATKTDNPLIKRVTDRFIQANNSAKAGIQTYVHDFLAPLSRDLKGVEKADAWALIKMAETNKTPLTEAFMKEHGANQKQVDWAMGHQQVMSEMYPKLKAIMEDAGLKAVSPETAYVAAKSTGDFRRRVYNDKGEIIGVMGAQTRWGLDKDIAKYKELNPNAKIGEELYFGGNRKGGTAEGFAQMLEFLAKDSPEIKQFAEHAVKIASDDAFNFRNAKTHTMQKKGVFGMDGNKPYMDAVKNAEEGMQAQLKYVESMIEWAELSKAVKETKEFLAPENGLNMPKAKAYLKDYVDNALGNNPTEMGRALSQVSAAFGKSTGLGTTIPSNVLSVAKQSINSVLLGGSPLFLATQMIQPFKSMPSMMARLESMGLKKDFDFGTGYSYLARGLMDMTAERSGKVSPLAKQAFEYADKNHVYTSDLFEGSNRATTTAPGRVQKALQFGSSEIEKVTRKSVYLAMTHMLNDNGVKPSAGLFEAAHKMTDMTMNNYSRQEAPMGYNAMGGLGRAAYNLMAYKHNELSRLSMLAREFKNDGAGKPLLLELMSQVAFSGIKGTILYAEANEIVKYISNKMGKPTSITKMMFDNDVPPVLTHGMFALAGGDMSQRLGMSIIPSSVADTALPGSSKLGAIASTGAEAVTNPSEFNTKSFIREAAPSGAAGLMDRAWFSQTTPDGRELAINRNKIEASAVRNDADKMWKNFGGTGLNESIQKEKTFINNDIDRKYMDKRTAVLTDMKKELFTKGKIDANTIQRYIKAQGDVVTLPKDLLKMETDLNIDKGTRELLQNAASPSITNAHKLMRRVGKE